MMVYFCSLRPSTLNLARVIHCKREFFLGLRFSNLSLTYIHVYFYVIYRKSENDYGINGGDGRLKVIQGRFWFIILSGYNV